MASEGSSHPPHSQHPLADILGAIEGLRDMVKPIPGEMRALGHRMAKLEERQESTERRVAHAETVATGASRRVSELEGKTSDVTEAMQRHVETITTTSKALVKSNEKQNVVLDKQTEELDRQTIILKWIKRWTPVIAALAALLGTTLGAGVTAYMQMKALESAAHPFGGHTP